MATKALTAVLDSHANPRVFAWFRIVVGLAALAKGGFMILERSEPAPILPWMALAVCVSLGWFTRWVALAMLPLGAYLLSEHYANHFYLLAALLPLVVVSETDLRYAVRASSRGDAPGWPLALMRCQASLVYLYSGIAKLNGEFLHGDSLAWRFDRSVFALPTSPEATIPLALAATALELFIGVGLWFPRLRPVVFGLVLPLHLAMFAVTDNLGAALGIGLFALLMFVLLQAFVDTTERSRLVVWDDQCTFCRRWIGLTGKLDVFEALRFVGSSAPEAYDRTGVTPAAAAAAMQLVTPDGRVLSGFAAVRGIVGALPFGFLLAPWMALPGVRQLGERAYRAVAARRACAHEAPVAG